MLNRPWIRDEGERGIVWNNKMKVTSVGPCRPASQYTGAVDRVRRGQKF
jgi:hypothetical protein